MSRTIPNIDPATRGRLRRWLARNRLVRAARCARAIRQKREFVAAELLHRDGRPRRWELADRSGSVVLRAGTGDFDIFEEIFRAKGYMPPARIRALLGDDPHIADLGANVGLFSAWAMSEFPGARTRCFEPDPANFAGLQQCMTLARRPEAWELHPEAVGIAPGTMAFRAGQFELSRAATGDEPAADVIEVGVVDVFPLLADADFVKIDIEGGEWPILRDPRLAHIPARAIALEYHRRPEMPTGEPPDVAERLLRGAGFEVEHIFWNPPWAGALWAWRPLRQGD